MPPRGRRTLTAAAGAAFLQALSHESPQQEAVIMLDWLQEYIHNDEQMLDRRSSTVLEAAKRIRRGRRDLQEQARRERQRLEQEQAEREQEEQEDEDEEDEDEEDEEDEDEEEEREVREQQEREQADREQADREQAEREQAEREVREQQEREQAERDRLLPSQDSPVLPSDPTVLINTSTDHAMGGFQDYRSRVSDASEEQSSSQSRSPSSLASPAGSNNVEADVMDPDHDDLPSQAPSASPDPHNSHPRPTPSTATDEVSEEGRERESEVHGGSNEDIDITENATDGNDIPMVDRLGENTAGSRGAGQLVQPEANHPTHEDSPLRNLEHDDVDPQPIRLSVWTNEPHFRATLHEILQLPQSQSQERVTNDQVQALLELVASWFDISRYKELGISMAYLFDRTSVSNIPRDIYHEPIQGYSLSGKHFPADDPPAIIERLRDRWNNTRSIRSLGNKFWQTTKFRLAAMELYVHWCYLQKVYQSEEPEFATERKYIQRLVEDSQRMSRPPGRKSVGRLKLAIAPFLGMDVKSDKLWKYAIDIGSRVAVLKAHWGLIALARNRPLIRTPTSLLARTIPAFVHRHPSIRDISLVISYNYVQPLWSEGSLDKRCQLFANSIKRGDDQIKQACQDNQMGLVGIFGYRKPHEILVPEMTGALPSTPLPREGQGAMMTPPATRERVSVDLGAIYDAEPDDNDERGEPVDDAVSSSAEDGSSSRSESEGPTLRSESASQRSSRTHPPSQVSGGSSSPTPSTRFGSGRVKRQRRH